MDVQCFAIEDNIFLLINLFCIDIRDVYICVFSAICRKEVVRNMIISENEKIFIVISCCLFTLVHNGEAKAIQW